MTASLADGVLMGWLVTPHVARPQLPNGLGADLTGCLPPRPLSSPLNIH
jgi:hypothetical protein